jgi:HK97 family phage prohead protease
MEIKQKIFESKALDLNTKGQVLIAVNALGNIDSDNDISKPGSFAKTLKENFERVRWFLNHDTTQLLGVPIEGKEEGKYLKMKAQFNMEKQIAKDTYEDYKLFAEHGKSLEHSIGVQPIKYNIDENTGVRTITEWKLWEFSTLTHWGANSDTPLLGIKGQSQEDLQKMLEEMIDRKYSDTRKKQIEKTYTSLFVEPSRHTLDERADMRTILKLIKINT